MGAWGALRPCARRADAGPGWCGGSGHAVCCLLFVALKCAPFPTPARCRRAGRQRSGHARCRAAATCHLRCLELRGCRRRVSRRRAGEGGFRGGAGGPHGEPRRPLSPLPPASGLSLDPPSSGGQGAALTAGERRTEPGRAAGCPFCHRGTRAVALAASGPCNSLGLPPSNTPTRTQRKSCCFQLEGSFDSVARARAPHPGGHLSSEHQDSVPKHVALRGGPAVDVGLACVRVGRRLRSRGLQPGCLTVSTNVVPERSQRGAAWPPAPQPPPVQPPPR